MDKRDINASWSGGRDATSKPVAAFIDKFDPKVARGIRQCRTELRLLLPTTIELVYDNYNFFVIG